MEDQPINTNQQQSRNQTTINSLYKSLSSGDTTSLATLLATDLEWWFHGPQNSHHMMKMLTGEAKHTEFRFEPRGVTTIDDHNVVIVEGYEGANVYWVHVWVIKDGLITRFREYFNTWLTVKKLRERERGSESVSLLHTVGRSKWTIVWRSEPRDLFRRSLPGLMLAI